MIRSIDRILATHCGSLPRPRELLGPLDAKDSGATINGTAIQGGTAQKLAKGDRIMVPAGVAHWYSDVQGEFVGATLHVSQP